MGATRWGLCLAVGAIYRGRARAALGPTSDRVLVGPRSLQKKREKGFRTLNIIMYSKLSISVPKVPFKFLHGRVINIHLSNFRKFRFYNISRIG